MGMHNAAGKSSTVKTAVFPELAHRPSSAHASEPVNAQARAHAILEQAERQAQALMESARQKVASLVEAAHREGALQGRAEALAEAREGLREVSRSLAAVHDRLRALETETRARAEECIVDLSVALARRILETEVSQDPAAILRIAKTALAALPSPEEVTIRVHPDQAGLLQAHRDELIEATPELAGLRIHVDATVAPGGCLVETPHSVADATFPAQLDEARRRLLEAPW